VVVKPGGPATVVISNNGNNTITDLDLTQGDLAGTGVHGTLSCPVTALAPQQSTTCTVTGHHRSGRAWRHDHRRHHPRHFAHRPIRHHRTRKGHHKVW
jgi:hypothetical protein